MNKTFKIIFNKARGALMVANEMTKSVQKKGVRTVIAGTAVALASSLACAATTYDWSQASSGTDDATGYSTTDTQVLGEDGQPASFSASTEKGFALGASASGASLTIKGSPTNISAISTGGKAYGVRGTAGSTLDFLGAATQITVDNATATDAYAQGVYANQSTFNFDGNTIIDVKGNTRMTLGVNVECDKGDAHDTIVNFNGDDTNIKVSTTSGEAYGVSPSGAPGVINFNGKTATLTTESTSGNVYSVQTQYGGLIDFKADATLNATVHGEEAGAFGVSINNYANSTGNAKFGKTLTINATADGKSGYAFGIYNDANSTDAPDSSTNVNFAKRGTRIDGIYFSSPLFCRGI